mgnify:CR=1 FL=1
MLFTPDPNGNARYQLPGDSYFAEEKLMDIRRHNRMNKYPAPYTIESPQPQLIGEQAAAWAQQRLRLLADKYLGSAGNKLDPTAFRVADIYDTTVCPLARVMRRECRKRGIRQLKCVYSQEEAITPGEGAERTAQGRPVPGSCAFVPSMAGLILAGEVLKDLAFGTSAV